MKVVDNANSRELVRFALQTKENLIIEKSKIESIDYIVSSTDDNAKKYGIVIRYRNIPDSETRSTVFNDLEKIKENCNNNQLIPTIAFILYDKAEKSAYVFLVTVEKLEELANSKIIEDEISYVDQGIQIKYGINLTTEKKMLDELKAHLDYVEITTGKMDFRE